jgi:hypothetical protein
MRIIRQIFKIFFLILFLFLPVRTTAVSQTTDQSYLPAATAWDAIPAANYTLGQSFKPSLNRLTRIDVVLNGVAADVTLTLADSANNFLTSETKNTGAGTIAFTFPSPVSVTPEAEYRLFLTDNGAGLNWGKTNVSGYNRGVAFVGGVPQTGQDHLFRTWGYNIIETQPSDPSVLEPPTDLKAEDVPNDQGKAIKLSWQNTVTENYAGYNIYRAEKYNAEDIDSIRDYLLVGDITAGETTFLDEKDLDPTKTYYYVARTFKGLYESENSNEIEIQPKDDISPQAPANLKIAGSGKGWVELSWNKVADEDANGYQIKFGKDSTSLNETKEVDGNTFSVKIEGLRRGTTYYFVVTAFDTSKNISNDSNRVEQYIEGMNWIWYLFISIFFAACAGLYLWLAFKKKWWPFKRKSKKDMDKKTPNAIMLSNQSLEDKMAKAKKIGKVTHYFGKIGVGIVKVTGPVKVGDKLKFKGATTDFEQEITSMQVEHKDIEEAKKGDEVGIKVDQKVREDDEVFIAAVEK